MNPVPDMDGRLYWAILRSQGHWADSLYDLKKIKVLKDFRKSIDPYYERPWGKLAPGDFSAIGLMENLHTLIFDFSFPADEEPFPVNDFSFLTRCKKLKKLDVHVTNFTDCSLLAGLPQLKQVYLPAKEKLEHVEVLDTLSCEVKTDDPIAAQWYMDYDIIPPGEIPPPSGEFAIRFLGFDARGYTNGEITQAVLEKLARMIQKGPKGGLYMSMDEYGEDGDFLSVDLANGWAALACNFWDESGDAFMYLPINDKTDGGDEDAPVCIGGQSPVPKRFALDDLNLAAECALYFARTGKLYPGVSWAKFD